ncbi:hypothetical protein HG536_0G02000 [Torulaspora globosa]|uniref:Ubiquinone biosynthesis O-methyltransferase, mitochondrial n=1 Tax=Torulaspora globosa TaxID=48254 RepID=A0A7G3ZLF5_9SACH|nr:uncharacterized protein HG536_0G02000 [Torulaspora globosa]QLL34341.1 hypothetical protein HG536_0G02000 [Torulaspora globosa]
MNQQGLAMKLRPSLRRIDGLCRNTYRYFTMRQKSTLTSNDEISHFKELAPSWWDVNGPQKILHLMNNGRMDFIQRIMRQRVKVTNPDTYIPGFNYREFFPVSVSRNIQHELDLEVDSRLQAQKLSALDIGCGGGILSESLARLPYVEHVTGIDLTEECIQVAREHALRDPQLLHKLSYDVKSLEDVETEFDIVTCFEMLEHADLPSEILRHAWLRLKPNGVLFLSTINRDIVSWFATIFMAEYVLGIVPKGTHNLNKYINAAEIIDWFKNNEPHTHQILETKGTLYLPIKGWVEHDCSDVGNYFMAIRKLE